MNSETLSHLDLRAIRPWEPPGNWAGKPWNGWFVGLGQNRDSDTLTRSNFEVFRKALRELPEIYVDDSENDEAWAEANSVFVVRESHWAVGWIEWIAIHPSNEAALKLADELMCAIADYPVLDEGHWSDLVTKEIDDYWERESLSYRIDICHQAGESIFAARHNYPTETVSDHLRQTWE